MDCTEGATPSHAEDCVERARTTPATTERACLRSFLPGRSFPFPKSLYAVEDALRLFVGDKPDATVVDFFAGSGTTAHAVMRLNKQDGGRRQSISVTNNEVSADEQKALREQGLRPGDPEWERSGSASYITKPRITAAITGKTPDGEPIKGDYKFTDEFPMADGFEENVEFFTLTYEARCAWRATATSSASPRCCGCGPGRAGAGSTISRPAGMSPTPTACSPTSTSSTFLEALRAAADVRDRVHRHRRGPAVRDDRSRAARHVEPVRLYESYLRNFEIATGRGAR